MSAYGLTPDVWQRLVLDDWLGTTRGKWTSLTCGLSVPRQNGKNALLEMRELFGMVGLGERILHTAHQVKTAQKHFRRFKEFFGTKVDDPAARFPELNRLVREIRSVNGQEAIYLKNGGSLELVARSVGSGRGFTVDILVMDEAQDMSDEDLEALMPTTSAAPKGNPQWLFTGTPPGPKVNGEVFTRTRMDALSGSSKRLAWHEWSCTTAVDMDDHVAWFTANPALGTRLQFDVVEGERARFSDEGFGRERLGMWDDVSATQVIDADTWASREDTASVPVQRFVLAVDVNPEQTTSAIGLAGLRADGLAHIEMDNQRAGTGWVVPYLQERCSKNKIAAVVVDGKSAAASFVDELKRRKLPVLVTGVDEMATACSQLVDAAMEGTVRHTGQPQLTSALAVASQRKLGDRWAWNRRNSVSDITPLVACTLALWGVQALKVRDKSNARSPRRIY